MKESTIFTFPKSILPSKPAQTPEENPIRHTLSQQVYVKKNNQKNIRQQIHLSHKKIQYEDMGLTYSPQIPISFQNRSQLPNTSPFKKNTQQSNTKKYTVKPYEAQIQVKVISNNKNTIVNKQALNNKQVKIVYNQPHDPQIKIFESITYNDHIKQQNNRQVKKIDNSIIKRLNFDFSGQDSSRLAHQSNIQKQSNLSKNNKNNHQQPHSNQTQEKQALLLHLQELRSKIREMENLNSTLSMQFQMSRQKLLAKEAQNQNLKEKYQKINKLYHQSSVSEERYQKMEEELGQNRNLVNLFCEEIQEQKNQIEKLKNQLLSNQLFLQKSKSDIQKRQKYVEQQKQNILRKLSDLQNQKIELDQFANKLKIKNEQLSVQTANWQNSCKQLQCQLQRREQDYAAQRIKQKAQFKKIEQALEIQVNGKKQLSNQIKLNIQQIKESRIDISKLKESINQVQICLSQSQSQSSHKQQIINSLHTEMKQLQRQHEQKQRMEGQRFNATISNLQQQIHQNQSKIRSIEIHRAKCQEEFKRATEEKDIYWRQCKELRQQKFQLIQEKENALNQIKRLLAEVISLKETIRDQQLEKQKIKRQAFQAKLSFERKQGEHAVQISLKQKQLDSQQIRYKQEINKIITQYSQQIIQKQNDFNAKETQMLEKFKIKDQEQKKQVQQLINKHNQEIGNYIKQMEEKDARNNEEIKDREIKHLEEMKDKNVKHYVQMKEKEAKYLKEENEKENKHLEEIKQKETRHLEEIKEKETRHLEEIKEIQTKYLEEIKEKEARHQKEIKEQENKHEEKIRDKDTKHQKQMNDKDAKYTQELYRKQVQLNQQINRKQYYNQLLKQNELNFTEQLKSQSQNYENRIKQLQNSHNESLNQRQSQILRQRQRCQNQIKQSQAKWSQFTIMMHNKQTQITQLNDTITKLNQTINQKNNQNQAKQRTINDLKLKIKNLEKFILCYKQSLSQLKINSESKWQQMKLFYEQQFASLQAKLREYSELQNSKRSFKNLKKLLLKQQTTTVLTQSTQKTTNTIQQQWKLNTINESPNEQ